eukprot:TRINITY_DN1307_c0_g1_i1.p1 TRINITY_DN1307_c0_g1~~TRINITY_DN1307_c0_g1_i1.p1  ORF type:complete len:362 (-),score=66.69 TRINITY_DN1307_c0_g1_i1:283-1368(-)
MSSTYVLKTPKQLYSKYLYTRMGNPTRTALEECLAALEHGKFAIACSSGCSAMTSVLHTLSVGDHMISMDDIYGGTTNYLMNYTIKKHSVDVDFVDMTDVNLFKSKLKKNTKLIWIESPTNPTMKIVDIEAIIKCTREFNKDIRIVVDNTFSSPYLQNPLLMGADIVVHSLTKYVGGHSDIIMGAVVCNDEKIHEEIHYAAKSLGANPSPFDCYLAIRGVKSLEARMKVHCKNAYALANFFSEHKAVEKVLFPGLDTNPYHGLMKKQMKGCGGMISIVIKGGEEAANKFCANSHIFALAVSLGGVESLLNVPKTMTHKPVPEETLNKLGITSSFIRISVGIESIEDLIADMDNALNKSQEP